MPISKLLKPFRNLTMTVKLTLMAFGVYLFFAILITPIMAKMNLAEEVVFFQKSSSLARAGAVQFLKNREVPGACDYLAQSFRDHLLSFYVIQGNSNLLCSQPREANADINLAYHDFGKLIQREDLDYSFQSDKIGNLIVTTGSINNSNAKLWQYLKALSGRLIVGPTLIFLIFALIFWVASLPWRKLTARLRSDHTGLPSRTIFDKLARTKESTLIQAATDAFYIENSNLRERIKFIADDFSHSLRQDMEAKGAQFPFFFPGTVLRFDLNDYTKLYYENDKPFINRIIRTIAVQVDEIVNRYKGVHYSFGGDEFVQVFKNTNDSILSSIACIRDIFEILPTLQLEPEVLSRIKFKASISFEAQNMFAELPQCDSLTSNALILTNRYFSAVEEKRRNILVVGQQELSQACRLASFEAAKPFYLKNIHSEHWISQVQSFYPVKAVLETAQFDLLPFYRTDNDISVILTFLKTSKLSQAESLKIVAGLKDITVFHCSEILLQAWTATLQALDLNWQKHERLLSSLIISGKNLIPQTSWNSNLTHILTSLKVNSDARANSDIVELLSTKLSANELYELEDAFSTTRAELSVRAQGNLILAHTIHSLSQDSVRKIQSLLESQDPHQMATGIYCASRVIQKYRKENPVALSQFLEFQDFIQLITQLAKHPDSMVQARATIEEKALSAKDI